MKPESKKAFSFSSLWSTNPLPAVKLTHLEIKDRLALAFYILVLSHSFVVELGNTGTFQAC